MPKVSPQQALTAHAMVLAMRALHDHANDVDAKTPDLAMTYRLALSTLEYGCQVVVDDPVFPVMVERALEFFKRDYAGLFQVQ